MVSGSPSAGDSASFYSKRKASYRLTTTERTKSQIAYDLHPESTIVSSRNDKLCNCYPPRQIGENRALFQKVLNAKSSKRHVNFMTNLSFSL